MTVVGIDLGTSNSCVAILKGRAVHIIEDETGNRIIPSVVTVAENGEILVGTSAKNSSHMYPNTTISGIKRLMGQTYFDKNVQKSLTKVNYDIINENTVPKVQIVCNGEMKKFSPEEISAKILHKLKDMAEKYLKHEVSEAVITVPAYFSSPQRTATVSAAKLAGFDTVHIISEPTAAALAFQFNNVKKFKRTVLIYDFGGGTFDVSIVAVVGLHCTVLATSGDCFLGGTDIDKNLEQYILDEIKKKTGFTIKDKAALRRINNRCEEIKKLLSSMSKSEIELSRITPNNKDYIANISRQKFEELNMKTFQKTLAIVEDCLSEAHLKSTDIDEVVLVGGSSRIPKIQDMIKNMFGKNELNKTINPDEAVAFGAAVYAKSIQSDKVEVEDESINRNTTVSDKIHVTFQDVLPLSLGTSVKGDIMSTIIKRNSPLPVRKTETYITASHFQRAMLVKVYQGESLRATNNQFLGKFVISNLRKAGRGETKVDITFEFDSQGVLKVTASENDAQNYEDLTINVATLSDEEILSRLEQSEMTKEEEIQFVRFAEKLNNLEEFCEDIQMNVDNMNRELKNKIDDVIRRAKSLTYSQISVLDELEQEIRYFQLKLFNNI